jgi:hypothetical protein
MIMLILMTAALVAAQQPALSAPADGPQARHMGETGKHHQMACCCCKDMASNHEGRPERIGPRGR